MEFLAKAAALALSVLASIFTNVEAPTANAKAVPAVTQASLPRSTDFVVFCTKSHASGAKVNLVLVSRQAQPMQLDSESERFLALIGKGQSSTKPLAVKPWYAQPDLFATPSVDTTGDVLRALLADSGDL